MLCFPIKPPRCTIAPNNHIIFSNQELIGLVTSLSDPGINNHISCHELYEEKLIETF